MTFRKLPFVRLCAMAIAMAMAVARLYFILFSVLFFGLVSVYYLTLYIFDKKILIKIKIDIVEYVCVCVCTECACESYLVDR